MVNDAGGTQGGFTLQPHMIPELQKAYTEASQQLQPLLAEGRGGFTIEQPAMADEASTRFQAAFNQFTGGGPESMRGSLEDFQQRLNEAVEKLGAIQRAYEANETDTAEALSRQLEP